MTLHDLQSKSTMDASSKKLSDSEVENLANQLSNWEVDEDGALVTSFETDTFPQAMSLANSIAVLAEEENHHPDILIHDHKFVTLSLLTHSVEGLSEKDFIFAAKVEQLVLDEGENE